MAADTMVMWAATVDVYGQSPESLGYPLTSGYARNPLGAKLGLRPGQRIALEGEPDRYLALLGPLPAGAEIVSRRAANLDMLHLFAWSRRRLETRLPQARRRIKPDGMLWVSWPKLTSALAADLDENAVREIGLANGLVDVQVAAVDEDWSALKFVFPLQDRSRPGAGARPLE